MVGLSTTISLDWLEGKEESKMGLVRRFVTWYLTGICIREFFYFEYYLLQSEGQVQSVSSLNA